MNFDSWFCEWAEEVEVTRTYRKIKQFLCIKIEQWNSSQSHEDSPFFLILSLIKKCCLWLLMKSSNV